MSAMPTWQTWLSFLVGSVILERGRCRRSVAGAPPADLSLANA